MADKSTYSQAIEDAVRLVISERDGRRKGLSNGTFVQGSQFHQMDDTLSVLAHRIKQLEGQRND